MIRLTSILIEILQDRRNQLINEVSIQQLEDNFVKTGRLPQNVFDEILKVTKNDSAFATWLVARVAGSKNAEPVIKAEDIYKYEQYFDVFKRRKKEYKIQDINKIKTPSQIADFINTSVNFLDQEERDPSKQKGISKTERFKDLKIADIEGYSVYMIPKGRKDLYPSACEIGSGTQWCTATGNTNTYFEDYIEDGPLFIFIDNENPKNKYQIHFESEQFMDKNDNPIYY